MKLKWAKADLKLFHMMVYSDIEKSCTLKNGNGCLQNDVFQPNFNVESESLQKVPCPLESHR
jgi:hypothetical protein